MSDHDDLIVMMAHELQRLRVALDHAGVFVFTKDRAGRYTYANNLVCALFGVTYEQLIGRDDRDFFDLTRTNPLSLHDMRVMNQGETIRAEEENVMRATGQTRIYWTVKAPIRDRSGAIVGLCGISTDITERKQREEEQQRQRLLLDTVLNHVDAYIYIKSPDHRYLYVNQHTAALYGTTPQEVIGRSDQELMPDNPVRNFGELDHKVFEQGCKQSGEEAMRDREGRLRYYWTVKVPITLPEASQALIGFSTDITALHFLKEELKNQALTDSLTGVSNHRHFFQSAEREMAVARRQQQALSVLLIDLDHFKQINDQYGHQAGDRVLKTVAGQFQAWLRKSDVLGRIGGEEFAVLLPATSPQAACQLAERMRSALRVLGVDIGNGEAVNPTISVGVASLLRGENTFDTLLHRADRAMYQAKSDGRDCVRSG